MLLALCLALVPQAPPPGGATGRTPSVASPHSLVPRAAAGRTPALTSPPSLVPRVAAFALAAAPFAAIAEGAALFDNAAAPGDIGMRPTIGGVNLFAFYAVYQVCFQTYLRLRPGGADVAFINGTKTVNGKRVTPSPFARTIDQTVEAAAEAARRLREGKPGER